MGKSDLLKSDVGLNSDIGKYRADEELDLFKLAIIQCAVRPMDAQADMS